MGDSFFGFNTSLPTKGDDEAFHRLAQKERAAREDADVYDFASLRDELGGDDDEVNDGLGDQLEEVGDDFNDETFGASDIGQDFDFAANTVKFTANLPEEERGHRFVNERQEGHRWNTTQESHNEQQRMSNNGGAHYDDTTMATKSIWGNFGNSDSFSATNQGNMSPFGHHQQPGYANVSPSSSMGLLQQQQQRQHRSLEEIEAEMQRHKHRPAYGDEFASGKKVLSLAEVEAAMMQGNGRDPILQQQQQHQQQLQQQHLLHLRQQQEAGLPPFGFGQPDPAQIMAMQQQHELMEQMSMERELKRQETMRKSQYDNLMTQHDKDLIQRIQLTQLASGDPYADDFYYQVYSSLRMRAAGLGGNKPTSNEPRGRGRREDNMVQRMQQQVQRIVNDAKRRPKQTQVTLEGALGKISSLSTRNPRQILQVSDKKANHHDETDASKTEIKSEHHEASTSKPKNTTSLNDRRRILNVIEDLYCKVLELEQMRRQGPPRSRRDDEYEQERRAEEWNGRYNTKVQQLWSALKVMESGSDDSTPLLVPLLSVNKGKKLIPRIIRPLSHDQSLTMLSVIIANFGQLQVCQHVIYPGTQVAHAEEAQRQRFVLYEDVELFMNAAAPSLLGFITEAPLQVVIGLTRLFMEKNDVRQVAQTKPGLAFLTMLLSRAEILKQGGGALHGFASPSPEDLSLWQDVYIRLFSSLQGHYSSIFPSLYYLAPLTPAVDMMQLLLSIDDMYIWQFLAAVAVGASMEQQHILVTEVRDRVMENIILAKSNRLPLDRASHRIDNTNLFLHSLGLDASQVTV
ncbi:topoisomerase II-associated protein PAT1 [Chlamydoabsidia padenii]|nr:topoisomerase II-associated protein PAT1 [Chlamydoabsidia padenii]